MTVDDGQDDPILAAVASVKSFDVSAKRARQLRQRCRAVLQTRSEPRRPAVTMMKGSAFQRLIGPALGGAWCLAYLGEIFRRAAAVYFAAQ